VGYAAPPRPSSPNFFTCQTSWQGSETQDALAPLSSPNFFTCQASWQGSEMPRPARPPPPRRLARQERKFNGLRLAGADNECLQCQAVSRPTTEPL
jgi:hypothetical protein